MTITVHHADCLDLLPTLESESIDACVTDPPYGLTFMGRGWDHAVPGVPFWREVFRVLKPGAHLVAFGGTRTYHRLVCAIEDAGFEVRDQLGWCFGSGFPKSLDIGKAIDKAAGAEREVVSERFTGWAGTLGGKAALGGITTPDVRRETTPATDAARQWDGWGTALKPAWEPICLARKPLSEPTVAANVLRWGTGGLNIDGCRVEGTGNKTFKRHAGDRSRENYRTGTTDAGQPTDTGRWPANLCHDGSPEVMEAFARFGDNKGGAAPATGHADSLIANAYGARKRPDNPAWHGDTGTAARFFYSAKASADDRLGSKHPTVKPVSLLRWLARLVTPPGGTILDPFAGSGTLASACYREGFGAVLVEREAEYVADIRARIAHHAGPLFQGNDA